MSWAEDKRRIADMGAGPVLLCVLLLVLCLASAYQLLMLSIVANSLPIPPGDEFDGLVLRHKLAVVVRAVLFLSSAFALFFSTNKMAVFLTISAVLYNSLGALRNAYEFAVNSRLFVVDGLFDILLLILVTTYLLMSPNIERLYHPGTRRTLVHGGRNAWRRIRSRPTLEETESAYLNETFK